MSAPDPYGSWGIVTDPYRPPELGPETTIPTCCNAGGGGGGGGGPTSFANVAMSIERRCAGGNYFGPPACVSVAAGVFSSDISQEDADAQAIYAGNLAAIGLSHNCCVGDPEPVTKLEDVIWSVIFGQFAGGAGTGSFTWDDPTATGTATTTLPSAGAGTTTAGVRWTGLWCNPWPAYNLTVTIDWSATGTGGAVVGDSTNDLFRIYVGTDDGSIGDIVTTVPAIGSTNPKVHYAGVLDNKSVLLVCDGDVATKSGTFVVTVPINQVGAVKLIVEAVAVKFAGNTAPTVHFDISNIHISPPVPPVTTIPCAGEITTIPVPFHYADRPENDDFEDAELVSGASGTALGNNHYASPQTDEPTNIAGGASNASIWYKWIAPSTGTVNFDTLGSDFDTLLAAYSGADLASLVLLDEDDDTVGSTSKVTFSAVSGTTYHIRVAGFNLSFGNVVLNWYP